MGDAMFNLFQNRSKERHALVIGNGAYEGDGRLVFPKNDARAVAGSLEELGFQVTLCLDQDRRNLELSYLEFKDNLQNAKLALVYYSGHGCQIDGRNYLVPIDVGLSRSGQFEKIKPFDMSRWANELEERADRRIFILDACRNNPFLSPANSSYMRAKRIELSQPNLEEARPSGGLTEMDVGAGAYLAFAAAPGRLAEEPAGDYNAHTLSFYTEALCRHLPTNGLPISELFSRIGHDVVAATAARQTPWISASPFGKMSFRPISYGPVFRYSIAGAISAVCSGLLLITVGMIYDYTHKVTVNGGVHLKQVLFDPFAPFRYISKLIGPPEAFPEVYNPDLSYPLPYFDWPSLAAYFSAIVLGAIFGVGLWMAGLGYRAHKPPAWAWISVSSLVSLASFVLFEKWKINLEQYRDTDSQELINLVNLVKYHDGQKGLVVVGAIAGAVLLLTLSPWNKGMRGARIINLTLVISAITTLIAIATLVSVIPSENPADLRNWIYDITEIGQKPFWSSYYWSNIFLPIYWQTAIAACVGWAIATHTKSYQPR